MRRILPLCLLTLSLVWTLCPAALAIEPMGASVTAQVCYPTSISRSEDGAQLKKIYDLGPEEDPAGIPRSDFEQDGFHYWFSSWSGRTTSRSSLKKGAGAVSRRSPICSVRSRP